MNSFEMWQADQYHAARLLDTRQFVERIKFRKGMLICAVIIGCGVILVSRLWG
jgi:hypothetical protein